MTAVSLEMSDEPKMLNTNSLIINTKFLNTYIILPSCHKNQIFAKHNFIKSFSVIKNNICNFAKRNSKTF